MKKRNTILNIFLGLLTLGCILSCSSDDSSEGGGESTVNTPVLSEISDISTSGFVLSWNSVFGAGSYEIDISTQENFSDFIEGYNAKSVTALREEVSDVADNTTYYVRIRAIRGGESSANSSVQSATTPLIVAEDATLKNSANFLVGVAISADRTRNSSYDEIYRKEFSSLTAENDMKMDAIFLGLDASNNITFNWTDIDAIVDYAEDNDFNLHGHTLIWHRSVPQALVNFTGTNEEFEAIIKDYITQVFTRYKGKIDSWDVVNEAIDDNQNIQWRNTLFLERMGENYVEKCFAFAREADPDVKLFYNDYNMTFDPIKRGKVLDLAEDLKSKNLIDGVGYQMHIDHNFPSREQIQQATDELLAKDLLIHFAELDVKLNAAGDQTELTEERSEEQKQKVKEVVEIFNALPAENKYALTVWGLKDNDSWIPFNNEFSGKIDWPLLFDNNFNRKPAYNGFIEGL